MNHFPIWMRFCQVTPFVALLIFCIGSLFSPGSFSNLGLIALVVLCERMGRTLFPTSFPSLQATNNEELT